MKFKRPCAGPGCSRLTLARYCEQHATATGTGEDGKRPSAYKRGYTKTWQQARLIYLAEHPLCVECEREGRTEAATVVHHKVAHRGNYDLFWNVGNWQALCKRHHDHTAKDE